MFVVFLSINYIVSHFESKGTIFDEPILPNPLEPRDSQAEFLS